MTRGLYSIGKAGLEKHLELPDAVAVEQMVFVEEQVLAAGVSTLFVRFEAVFFRSIVSVLSAHICGFLKVTWETCKTTPLSCFSLVLAYTETRKCAKS